MSEEEERKFLLNELLTVLIPVAPDSPSKEKEHQEMLRSMYAQNRGWFTCPIETLRWEVFHGAA